MVALQILVLTVGVRILLGELTRLSGKNYCWRFNSAVVLLSEQLCFLWPLRITASTADSHSVNRSSILLGAKIVLRTALISALFFY